MKSKWKKIGTVGVDAGLLMIGDPCYFVGEKTEAQKVYPSWSCFCDELANGEPSLKMPFNLGHEGMGVAAGTAHGDGIFPVYGLFDERKTNPLAMMVVTDEDTEAELIKC